MTNRGKHMTRMSLTALLMAGTAMSTGGAWAQAQTGAEAEDRESRDVITVTATRREQNILDVPYNISAVSGTEIEDAQMLDNADLLRSIPGVAVVDRGARNSGTLNAVRMRGLSVEGGGQGDIALSSVASVSTYVNDTPVFANFALTDLERVEVLRGPQGTLYGSGSLGGTIRYITRDPVFGEFAGFASLSTSHVNGSESIGVGIEGVVNVPLGDRAGFRLAAMYGDYPGITDYVNVYQLDGNGNPLAPNGVLDPAASYRSVEDADTVDTWMARGTFLFEPTDNLEIRLVHARQDDDVGGRRQPTRGLDGFGNPYGEYENGSIQLEPSSREVNATSLEVSVDLGFATLTSSTSHYDHTGDSTSENTGFYAQAGFLAFYYNYPRPMASAVRSYADEAVIEEIRLVSDDGGNFDYVVGAFFREQQLQSTQDSYLRGFKAWWDAAFPAFASAVTGDRDFAYNRIENFSEQALFGELTWYATEEFSLTGGFRYFDNESENLTFIGLPLYAGLFPDTTAQFSTSESDTLFKLTASYEPNDTDLLYATISEGYRRGGSNAVPLTGVFAEDPGWQRYGADRVVNYEAGWKGERNGLRFDLSLFYIDWDAPQLNSATSNWGFYAVINGDSARTAGFEAQLSGSLGETVNYQLGYAYVNAELTSDFFAPDNAVTPIAVDGAQLPGTPEHMLNWAFDRTFYMDGDWSLFTRLDGYYQSETRNGVGTSPRFNVPLEGFAIWNAVATASRGDLSASLWIRNIFNEEGVTGTYTEAYMGTAPAIGYFGNGSKDLISLPRTIGATIRYDF